VIEDAAQAIGAEYKGRRAGSIGEIACFSFFPSKNLGAYGDGGMLTTNDDALAGKLASLRVHGAGQRKYYHDHIGVNSRLDALQAAVLLAKLPWLQQWSEARRARAHWYNAALAGVAAVRTPVTDPLNEHIFHQYVIETARRDELQTQLKAAGIGTAVYYPVPLHRQPCFAYLGYRDGQLPVSERAATRVLALPVYPELTEAQQQAVVAAIRRFHGA